jgi:hypothetical protein
MSGMDRERLSKPLTKTPFITNLTNSMRKVDDEH